MQEINKKSVLSKLLWLFILVLIMVFWNFYLGYEDFKKKPIIENDLMVKIETSDNFLNLGNKIPELNTIFYKIYLRNNTPDFSLNAWMYKLTWGANIAWIFEDLQKPITDEISLTILEGWNIFDIDEYLTWKGLINPSEYIDYVRNSEKISALSEYYAFLSWKEETLEGFLYPDTYKMNVNFKINEFVIKQLDTFEVKVYDKILQKYDVGTINDIINLASIVEKEEKNPQEKPIVAWILKKRLNSGWQIWADVTVCYPHELTSNECKMVISKYISEISEYNTRTMVWLPKTPIWNPSFETINATLNDEKTDYWYYLHNISTGKIYYARTNAEHEANKQYMY